MRASYIHHAFAPHAHATFFVGVIERGVKRFSYRGSQETVGAAQVCLVNAGEVHTGKRAGGEVLSYRAFHFDEDLLTTLAQQAAERVVQPTFLRPVVGDKKLAASLATLHRFLLESSSTLERDEALHEVFTQLFGYLTFDRSQRLEQGPMQKVKQYLEAHFVCDVTLLSLAEVVGLTTFHLLRSFRRSSGFTPHEYQTYLRIERAKSLLRRGVPIVQVSLEVGYADQANFSKRFKQLTGMTPGKFRGIYLE
jgi:AraC-like DNA-binding protein